MPLSASRHITRHLRSLAFYALFFVAVFLTMASDSVFAQLANKTELHVSGLIGASKNGQVVELDMQTIRSLPQRSFVTKTPWYQQPTKFTGPLLRDVLKHVKAKGTVIHMQAIDGYRISIPSQDAYLHEVILAHSMNDIALNTRSLGPLRIVYNFDAQASLRTSKYYERSIWQLKFMEVR